MKILTSFVNVQNIMNINHFEQLMVIFQSHRNDDGTTGFDIDKFREVFGKVLGDNVSFDQMTMLFMKIDANSDGTMDWDEFSTYMMTVNGEEEEGHALIEERRKKSHNTPHRDMVVSISFVTKERKYLTVSRDGTICIWTLSLKLIRKVHASEFNIPDGWVLDAKFIQDANRLVLITDNRQMYFFDLFSIRPRLVAQISQLEYNPMCVAYTCEYDESTDLVMYGDDGGYVNILTLNRRFLIENNGDTGPTELITPTKLMRKDSMEKYSMSLYRRKVHKEWVLKVMYYKEMNAFVSCSSEDQNSLVMGDLERKTIRSISIPKGVETFEFCKRPSFLVTAGRDKTIRLWNPYVLSKPASSLVGHNAAIINLAVNNEESIIFSLCEDKTIRLWNARTLNCIQTLVDKVPHRPENLLTALHYDYHNRQLMTASSKIQIWPLFPNMKQAMARNTEIPIVAALFNSNFNQVVSGFQNGSIRLWDPVFGDKIFEFHRSHDQLELTAMCFDISGRRLITASRDKVIKVS
jgi:WD40 repeat protein